jgi:hypothetical protein
VVKELAASASGFDNMGNLVVPRSLDVRNSLEEGMAHIAFRAGRASHSSVDAARQSDVARESESNFHFSDDDFDFPPTAHPGRELFTFSLFVVLVMALVLWGGWKLMSLMISLF